MPQLSIKRFFSKLTDAKKSSPIFYLNSISNNSDLKNPVLSCSRDSTSTNNAKDYITEVSWKNFVFSDEDESEKLFFTEKNCVLEGKDCNRNDVSSSIASTSKLHDQRPIFSGTNPLPSTSNGGNSRWKLMLDNYDKQTSKRSLKGKPRKETKKRPAKQIKLTGEKPTKVSINIEDLSIQNFTEQLLALELIKDFLDHEEK
ncbi:hypothetical protein ACFFRR_001348 [Megaselia abdita]